MSNKKISWDQARTEMRKSRIDPSLYRECPSLIGGSLSGWKGASAPPGKVPKRYVVSIHPLTLEAMAEAPAGSVLIAVRREARAGFMVSATVRPTGTADAHRWYAAALSGGATELHVHRLHKTLAEARAIVADLFPAVVEPVRAA